MNHNLDRTTLQKFYNTLDFKYLPIKVNLMTYVNQIVLCILILINNAREQEFEHEPEQAANYEHDSVYENEFKLEREQNHELE